MKGQGMVYKRFVQVMRKEIETERQSERDIIIIHQREEEVK